MILVIGFHRPCLASPTRNTDDTERLIAIASKADAIDAKLDSLSSGHDRNSLLTRIEQRLDSIDTKLDGLAPQGGLVATESPLKPHGGQQINETHQETDKGQEEFSYNSSVNLISIERNPTSGGNRFTVRFTKNAQDLILRYNNGSGLNKEPDNVVEGGDGVWAVSFTCKPPTRPDQSMPWFIVGDKVEEAGWSFMDSRHMLHLQLNNSEGDAMFQQVEPLPQLHVHPPRAAIYQPGYDFNVTGYVTFADEPPQSFYLFESFDGINLTNGQFYMDMEQDDIFRKM
ncbi:hypothetical protein ElyMa_004593100 [Elysia marginata]|uniref:Uncharacterized protein n=1 Tax=Elysia marginata TaxID=1093978 RepID=A0AAV4HYW1_9GAST|nr:hypothetical protein ElyMa_004593100 [Elysia marginata]